MIRHDPLLGRERLGVPGRSGAPAEQRACTVSYIRGSEDPRMAVRWQDALHGGLILNETGLLETQALCKLQRRVPQLRSCLPSNWSHRSSDTLRLDALPLPPRQRASPADTWPPQGAENANRIAMTGEERGGSPPRRGLCGRQASAASHRHRFGPRVPERNRNRDTAELARRSDHILSIPQPSGVEICTQLRKQLHCPEPYANSSPRVILAKGF